MTRSICQLIEIEKILFSLRKYLLHALIVGILAATIVPARAVVTASKKLSNGAQYSVDGGTLRLQVWTPEIVRVTYAATNEFQS